MNRRNFIQSLVASGVLGASPLVANAAGQWSAAAPDVRIVVQSDLPPATALVETLEHVFAASGLRPLLTRASSEQLADAAVVAALLGQLPQTRLLGVMDDAAGVVFQALAAARGTAVVASTQHRFAADATRHCCTASQLDARVAWTDGPGSRGERIARLYAGMLGGNPPGSVRVAAQSARGSRDGGSVSLISFLMTTP